MKKDNSRSQTEGENISKVEKADILEVTVRHLQKEQSSRPMPSVIIGSAGNWTCRSPWHYGFDLCAKEAYNFLLPQYGDVAEGLAKYLTARLQVQQHTHARARTHTQTYSLIIIGSIRNYLVEYGAGRRGGLMRRKFLNVPRGRIYQQRSRLFLC
jgi:hypothetical protein